MKRALFSLQLLLMGHILLSQNLVINSGFETWTKINKPAGWTHIENCLKDSSSVISGSYACKHSGGATTTSDLGQTITVSPGKEYALTLYFKTVITASGNGARIWCYWKDASGATILDPATDDIMRPAFMKSSEWEQFSIIVLAPATAAFFYLEVRTYPNSIAYWDDIVFEETVETGNHETNSPDINIFPNPASNYLTISNIQNIQQIDIQSITGIVVWSEKMKGEQQRTIPVSQLQDGIYLIRIITKGEIFVRKFIKKSNQ
jgi:hypothetical protein